MQQVNESMVSHTVCECVTPETTLLPTATMTLLFEKPELWYHFAQVPHTANHSFLILFYMHSNTIAHTHMHLQKILHTDLHA